MVAIPKNPVSATVAAIWKAYEEDAEANRYMPKKLGAGIVGTECERALWYEFRWVTTKRHEGRMLRLFDTGHKEEARFVGDLRRIGVTVLDVDPEDGRQWRAYDATRHFGGQADAVCLGLPEAPKTWHLGEFKTHSAKSYNAVVKDGVRKAKPLHWAQMQSYMELMDLERALYFAKNKDNDDLHTERVERDRVAGIELLAKANRVVTAIRPPARISNDPTWFQCRFCDHRDTCHGGNLPERNCRTCMHSTPLMDGTGEWQCERHQELIDHKAQQAGCPDHRLHPDLVAGEQRDVRGNDIVYILRGGAEWIDDGGYVAS